MAQEGWCHVGISVGMVLAVLETRLEESGCLESVLAAEEGGGNELVVSAWLILLSCLIVGVTVELSLVSRWLLKPDTVDGQ